MATLVSVVIPTYNRAQLLKETIASVVNQSYRNIECLVIDDYSADNTRQVVESFTGNEIPVRYIRNLRRKGAQGARNYGVEMASGEYVQFLDSDDLIHAKKIELQVEVFDKNEQIDMVFCLDEYFSNRIGDTHLLWNLPNDKSYIDRFLYDDAVFHTSSPLWKKQFILRNKIVWDERLSCWQDWDFHLKALISGVRHLYIPYVLNFIRDHTELRSLNINILSKLESKLISVFTIAFELKNRNELTEERKRYLTTFLYSLTLDIYFNSKVLSSHSKNELFKKIIGDLKVVYGPSGRLSVLSFLRGLLFFSKFEIRIFRKVFSVLMNVSNFPSHTWKLIKSIEYRLN